MNERERVVHDASQIADLDVDDVARSADEMQRVARTLHSRKLKSYAVVMTDFELLEVSYYRSRILGTKERSLE